MLVGDRLVPDVDYPVGTYAVVDQDTGEVGLRIAIVAIVETESRVLVAVPFASWRRNISKRRLLPGALVKPVAATVKFVDKAEEASAQVEEEGKVWIGYLAKPHEDCVVFEAGGEVEEPDINFSVTKEPAGCLLPTVWLQLPSTCSSLQLLPAPVLVPQTNVLRHQELQVGE